MCWMIVESNLVNGGDEGWGLNNGILYMFVIFYFLIGLIGYVWWCNCWKEDELEIVEVE